jgi:hypothetical protein
MERYVMDGFDQACRGTPPWDIGAPQPVFVALAESGVIQGSVLEAGCGTGENALDFASVGHETEALMARQLQITTRSRWTGLGGRLTR